jgi:hypothetical protein
MMTIQVMEIRTSVATIEIRARPSRAVRDEQRLLAYKKESKSWEWIFQYARAGTTGEDVSCRSGAG